MVWLIFIDLPCLLPSVLEPHGDDSGTAASFLAQHFQVIVLRVGLFLEELLEGSQLEIGESSAIRASAGLRRGWTVRWSEL